MHGSQNSSLSRKSRPDSALSVTIRVSPEVANHFPGC
jgi:hypothetical protein